MLTHCLIWGNKTGDLVLCDVGKFQNVSVWGALLIFSDAKTVMSFDHRKPLKHKIAENRFFSPLPLH